LNDYCITFNKIIILYNIFKDKKVYLCIKMCDYSKGLIYKWICNDCDDIYVGSTINFTRRKQHHKESYKYESDAKHHYKIYEKMREYGGFENWRMVQIEEYPCESRRELEAREQHWITELKPTLNSKMAFRTEPWYLQNKCRSKEYKHQHYLDNKEKLQKKASEYYKQNADKIMQKSRDYYESNKEKVNEHKKEYQKKNKEKIQEYHKEYYQKNKKYGLAKVKCECGAVVSQYSLLGHKKSKKHMECVKCIDE